MSDLLQTVTAINKAINN